MKIVVVTTDDTEGGDKRISFVVEIPDESDIEDYDADWLHDMVDVDISTDNLRTFKEWMADQKNVKVLVHEEYFI